MSNEFFPPRLALTLTLSRWEREQLRCVSFSQTISARIPSRVFPEAGERFSLSPGERAGVRASVPLSALVSFNRRHHWPRVIRQRMRCAQLQFVKDGVAYRLLVSPQVGVPKAKLLDPQRSEKFCPHRVMGLLGRKPVLTAVQLNGQAGLQAKEIEEVNSARMPAPEFVSAKPPVAQPAPHKFFGPGWFFAQRASAINIGHGGRLWHAKDFEKIGFDDRPHPGPLPREREKLSASQERLEAPISTAATCSFDGKSERKTGALVARVNDFQLTD